MTKGNNETWARVARLFDEWVDLDEAERGKRMAKLTADEPLVAEQLAVLLLADSETEGILDASISQVLPELTHKSAAPAWETRAGTVFGPYRLLEPIGEGGMGEVWRAERADGAYQQQVAVKLLKRGLDTRAILRRFLQERSILARLDHPSIVRVFDGGMSPDGRPWYAMSLVEGLPIDVHAAAHGLDARARVALVAQVADAVAFAHARLVVHRDLKPGNVLVDTAGNPHLLDFGIAKLLQDTAGETATATQVRVLSPAYAAPEQILGQPVGTATDVYALGVLAFELLAGVLPHRRGTRDSGLLSAELGQESVSIRASQAILRGKAQLLAAAYGGHVEPRRLARQIAGDLDLILATALRAEPERRYASAAALAADMRAWLEHRPISARADSAGYRVRRFVRRHRLGVAAASLVLLSLVAGLTAAVWQAGVARDQAERAERHAQRAEATKNFFVSAFASLTPTSARDGAQLRLSEFLASTLARLDGSMTDAPEARIELRITLGQAQQELGDLESAAATFARAESELQQHQYLPATTVASLLHNMAMNRQRRGDLDAAEVHVRRALEALARDPAGTAREQIAVRTTLAYLATDRGRYWEALHQYEAILADRRSLFGVDDSRMAVDWLNLCAARIWLADYVQAEQDCRRSWSLLENDPQSPRARLAWVGNSLGQALQRQGRWDEAEQAFIEALTMVEQTLGLNHPMALTLNQNLANLTLERGDYVATLERIDALLAQPGNSDAPMSTQRNRLSTKLAALIGLDRLDEAEALVEQIQPDQKPEALSLTVNHLRLGRRLAELRLRQGRVAEATEGIESVLDAYRQLELTDHDDVPRALLLRAELADLGGDAATASAIRSEARTRAIKALGVGHPWLRQWAEPELDTETNH